MVLLLRYSGLRIQDAACLERARLEGDKLILYQQKTGNPTRRVGSITFEKGPT
jgi:hypothetical protein